MINAKVYLNNILNNINVKKQYIKKLQNKVFLLNDSKEKNYKNLSLMLKNKSDVSEKSIIKYIISISFSRTNTLLHVTDAYGTLKFFCSSGYIQYKGKSKKSRFVIFRDLYRILVSKLKFLKGQPVAVHLKNVGSLKFLVLRRLKKKFFVQIIRNFNVYPHNGCRKKKMRRKKFKKRRNGRAV
jgi:ribosomal protein S11